MARLISSWAFASDFLSTRPNHILVLFLSFLPLLSKVINSFITSFSESQTNLLPWWFVFQHIGSASVLLRVHPSFDPFIIKDCFLRTLCVLNRPNTALQESKVWVWLTPLLTSLRIKNAVISWSLCPGWAFWPPHLPPAPLWLQTAGLAGTTSGRLPYQLQQEVVFHILQEPPRLPPLCLVEFPANIQQAKAFHKKRDGDCELSVSCLVNTSSAASSWLVGLQDSH